jgi:phosphoglycolate phosphatase
MINWVGARKDKDIDKVRLKDQAIIFDLDGTLWDSSDIVAEIWTGVLNKHGREDVKASELRGQMGKPVEDIMAHLMPGLSWEDLLSLVKECSSAENAYLTTHGGHLFMGVKEILSELHSRYFIGLVSNCQEGYAKAFIEYYGMGGIIDDYEEAGRTGQSKAYNIGSVIRRNGIREAAYVGDTSLDKESAEEAGAAFIYASYGFGHIDDASYIIKNIKELPKVIDKIFGE